MWLLLKIPVALVELLLLLMKLAICECVIVTLKFNNKRNFDFNSDWELFMMDRLHLVTLVDLVQRNVAGKMVLLCPI